MRQSNAEQWELELGRLTLIGLVGLRETISAGLNAPRQRRCSGADHPRAKLTWRDVAQIRALYEPGRRGCGHRQLAKKFECSVANVRDIIHRRTWTGDPPADVEG